MLSVERLNKPYSVDDLRRILESLRKASLTDFRIEDAINVNDGESAILIGKLQLLAVEYVLYSELEMRPKYKNYREILKHIAASDFLALPDSVLDRIAPPTLHPFLKNDFERVRQKALAILSKAKRRKYARYDFVNELADMYEEVTGRKATKVGKETGEKSTSKQSGEKSRRKRIGLFYNFVLAALKPIDPDACTGIHDVIDEVIDARRKGRDLNLPL